MKRITAVILSVAMLLLLAACGNSASNGTENGSSAEQIETMTENTDTSAANNDADNPSESNRRQDIGTDSEGGSGIEQSINDLSEAYSDINIVSGHRFRAGDPAETVQEWLGSLE